MEVFYSRGLRFSCRRCSDCCRHEPGVVFLSDNDVRLLAEELKMKYTGIVENYCRWVPVPGGAEQLSLKEKPNFDCIFWDQGCTVYKSRPLQCRTFPFWESTVFSRQTWESLACPGAGKGELHRREYITGCLERRKAEPVLQRRP
ncbi:MAG: YkgJ family cysteine cluster protein [Treponema sp.]|nr:YkgJ family cysteine cluster protein [Treponema sp.]